MATVPVLVGAEPGARVCELALVAKKPSATIARVSCRMITIGRQEFRGLLYDEIVMICAETAALTVVH
jgi:hypothetical protein